MINITVLLPVKLHYQYNHKSTENPVSTRYKKM